MCGLFQFDVPAKKLDSGLADLLRVVVGVSGNGDGANNGQQSGDAAARDPLGDSDADAFQEILRDAQRGPLDDDSLAYACHQIAHELRGGVLEQAIDHRLFR